MNERELAKENPSYESVVRRSRMENCTFLVNERDEKASRISHDEECSGTAGS